jgi:hypothetical protein
MTKSTQNPARECLSLKSRAIAPDCGRRIVGLANRPTFGAASKFQGSLSIRDFHGAEKKGLLRLKEEARSGVYVESLCKGGERVCTKLLTLPTVSNPDITSCSRDSHSNPISEQLTTSDPPFLASHNPLNWKDAFRPRILLLPGARQSPRAAGVSLTSPASAVN